MNNINKNLIDIKTSATLQINEISKKLESKGKEIFKFGLGQSPFPIPKIIVNNLKENAHVKDYLNVSGLELLRKHVSIYHSKKNNFNYSSDDILIGPGSKELIFQTQLAYEGDLLLPIPSWVSYEPQAKIINKKIHKIESKESDNWHITPEALDKICFKLKKKQKLLILNSPNNPSGTSITNLKEIAYIARKNDILIISDEIYGELSFDGNYSSITHYYPEKTIISSGISKWCGAGGWRLGTLVFPKNLNKLKNIVRSIASETYTSVSAPIQYASVLAYSENHEVYKKFSRKILKYIAYYIHKKFSSIGIKCVKPQGGFYMLCDFSEVIKKTNEITDSSSLCKKILNEVGFAMLPGNDFGISENKLITRIAYVDFDGKKALEYLEKNGKIDEKFFDEICFKIKKGVNNLSAWISNQN